MRALMVYESMFGNTRTIAEAIAEGLTVDGVAVEVTEVGDAPPAPDEEVGLVVVGGPTHAFGLSRRSTRASAGEKTHGPTVSSDIGIRDWLDDLPHRSRAMAAAFDTHIDKRVPGSAARSAERLLRRHGFGIALPAESFFVSDLEGPLVDGEVERARRWGGQLAATISATSSG